MTEASPDARVAVGFAAVLYERDLVHADWEGLLEAMEPLAHPEIQVADTQPLVGIPTVGLRGVLHAWRAWLTAFSSYRASIEEIVDAGDGRVAIFSHDVATSRDGIPVETHGAAVYTIEDGLVRGAAYYTDADEARRSLAPQT